MTYCDQSIHNHNHKVDNYYILIDIVMTMYRWNHFNNLCYINVYRNINIIAEKQWLQFGDTNKTTSTSPPKGTRVSSTQHQHSFAR